MASTIPRVSQNFLEAALDRSSPCCPNLIHLTSLDEVCHRKRHEFRYRCKNLRKSSSTFTVCYFNRKFVIGRDSCFKNVMLPMGDVSLLKEKNGDFLVKSHEHHKADWRVNRLVIIEKVIIHRRAVDKANSYLLSYFDRIF